MIKPYDVSIIKPASVLLYNTPGDLVDEIITRTGPAAHVEIYECAGYSMASRNGLGVARYPYRSEGLIAVLEPKLGPCDDLGKLLNKLSAWFETVKGDGYDFNGLAGFIVGSVQQTQAHWFCSAFAAKCFEMAGFPLFNPMWSPSLITPSDFFKTPLLHWQWVDVSQIYDKSV